MKLNEYTKAFIYHFSGTGNTLLVAREIANVFNANGIWTELVPITKFDPENIDLNTIMGLAFPVAMQGTYKFIWEWVRKLPQVINTPVFMVDTLAGASGGIIGPLKNILLQKGYNPIGAKEIIMPNNFLARKQADSTTSIVIGKGLQKANDYANSIINGSCSWSDQSILELALSKISQSRLCVYGFSSLLKIGVDKHLCTECKLCEVICPVQNIKCQPLPNFDKHCVLCMRCFSFCPTNAIKIRGIKWTTQYHSVSVKEIISGN